MKRIVLVLMGAAVTATMLALAGPSFAARDDDPNSNSALNKKLTEIREATRKYQQLIVDLQTGDPISGNALEDGYTPPEDDPRTQKPRCVQPPGRGAMGYHYVNHTPKDNNLHWDVTLDEEGNLKEYEIDPLKPEALLYGPPERGNDPGELQLIAVEYIVPVPKEDADAKINPKPQLFANTSYAKDFDGHPQNASLPMDGHETWQSNPEEAEYAHPKGLHYDLHAWIWKYNPAVKCPTS